jgi:transcription termination/antitermination protein NusG
MSDHALPTERPAEPAPEAHAPEAPAPAAAHTPPPAPEEALAAEAAGAATAVAAPAEPSKKNWYVVKVQSGREESIKEAIERRVKIEGLEEYYGQIVIPVERITEIRNGKRVQKERKLYPGYLMVEVEYNDRILYLFRETSGVGDFVGGTVNRAPPPMPPREVERMLHQQGTVKEKETHAKPEFEKGDRVKVRDGTFAGMEGEVKDIMEAHSRVSVELTIFGRPVPVELEYWQVEPV